MPAAGLTMRINEGSFYTKNFTAMDLDGDYLVWSVTGLPGAEMVAENVEGTSAQLQWRAPYDPEAPGQAGPGRCCPPRYRHALCILLS